MAKTPKCRFRVGQQVVWAPTAETYLMWLAHTKDESNPLVLAETPEILTVVSMAISKGSKEWCIATKRLPASLSGRGTHHSNYITYASFLQKKRKALERIAQEALAS